VISSKSLHYQVVLVLVVLAFAAGCSGPGFSWAGEWKGRRDLKPKPGENEVILNTIAMVSLKLNPNGTFELFEGGAPKTGDYRIEGEKAFLKVKTFFDRPIEAQGEVAVKMNQEIELSAQKDGSILFRDPAGLSQDSLVLRREKSESQPAP